MQTYLRDQIDWEQPFSHEEYGTRRHRVRLALQRAGLDAIYITNPADLTWLTNYDMIWYHLQNLTGLLVRADRDEDVFFDSPSHTTIVSTTPEIRECVFTTYDRPHAEQIVEGIAARGLAEAKIGVQPWGYAPHASVSADLRAQLEAGGATVEDHSFLVEELRFVKSPAEVAVVRQAAGSAPPVVSVNVPAGHPMADQLTALGQRIDRAEDHFQVLDMPWDANPGSFRSAYVTLAQQLHPDRYTDAPAVLQDRATGLFDKVREAWEVPGNDEQRQAYIDKVVHGKKSEQELAMEQINAYWSAEADFKRGLAAFKNGRISQAHPAFRAASDAVPDELEWKAYHAYTTFHVNRTREPQKAEDAVEMLKNVLEANKAQERKLDSGWVLLGKTYRDRSMPDAAKRCFVQALRYNPSNADAQLELRRMKGDSDKDKGGGFFSKLFGKK